ncbi:MAG: hypothetical protein IKO03_04220 [Lachnospiraceae bacterium]|nr:hypothetical protein [Lachnospiraceae bacterium]
MLFGEVLSRYYTLVFIMVILLYTLFFNKMMYSKVGGRFLMIICLVILETIFSAAEVHYAGLSYENSGRYLASMVCYILRPMIMYLLLLIVIRGDGKLKQLLCGLFRALIRRRELKPPAERMPIS